jgi:hypothetical protein
MDKIEQLKESYSKILNQLEPLYILVWYDYIVENNLDVDIILQTQRNKIKVRYHDYLELIPEPMLKYIALNRLNKDFEFFKDDFLEEAKFEIEEKKRDINDEKFYSFSLDVEDWFDFMLDEWIITDLENLEFELIGATPPTSAKSNARAKKDSTFTNAMTRSQVALLFNLLAKKGLINLDRGFSTATCQSIAGITNFDGQFMRANIPKPEAAEIENLTEENISGLIQIAKDLQIQLANVKGSL